MGEYENISINAVYEDIQYIKKKVDRIEELYAEQEFERLLAIEAIKHEEKKASGKLKLKSEDELLKILSE